MQIYALEAVESHSHQSLSVWGWQKHKMEVGRELSSAILGRLDEL